MLKVIIIDDEQWSLEYMQEIIDWNENGAEIAAVFDRASNALNFLSERDDINLVFVDVEMPEISGLDFIESAKRISPNTNYVVISGYDVFKYAQQAIRSGAKDYLLKPVEKCDVKRILVEALEDAKARVQNAVKEIGIEELPTENIRKKVGEVWEISNGECVVCCITDAPNVEMTQIFKEILENGGEIRFYHSMWYHAFFITAKKEDIEAFILANQFRNHYHFGLYVTDNADSDVDSMPIKAKDAFEGRFFSPDSGAFVYDDDYEQWLDKDIFTVKKYLEEKNIIMVYESIRDFYDKLELKKSQANTGIMYYNKVIEFLNKNSYNEGKNNGSFIIDMQYVRKKFDNKENMVFSLQYIAEEWLTEGSDDIPTSKVKDFIPRIQKYINDNCQNELNLAVLASEFMVSGKYLSSVFKKTTGMNLNRYINTVRVKKARQMLEQTEISVQDVSYLCGYNDCSYFTKIFKRIIGVTPTEYRAEKPDKKGE